jgi:protein arginine N-methyltransferase 1
MSAPRTYGVTGYGEMIADSGRMSAYRQALQTVITPGCTVLDIGAGTGIFSLLACRMGAGHVHAVEPSPAIELGRQMAADNGFADRITFHRGLSTQLQLPARADVIVSDLRGVMPMMQGHIPSIIDARERLLAPQGTLVPSRDTLWAAVVEDETRYRPCVRPWRANDFGLDLRAGARSVVNSWSKAHANARQLLVTPAQWGQVDYRSVAHPDVNGFLSWTADRAGTAHALLLWFDAELMDGIGFSNAPAAPELIYGQAFLPLEQPVAVEPGDTITATLRADLVGDDYVWSWATVVLAASGAAKARFNQSSFYAEPLRTEDLRRREPGFTPAASVALAIERVVLEMVDGTTPLSRIAETLRTRFPQSFLRPEDALWHAADILARYDGDPLR